MLKKLKTLLFVILFFISHGVSAQNPVNWTKDQLMEPSALALLLKTGKAPLMFSIGPAATIPQSVNIGMLKEEDNLAKLEMELNKLTKDTKVVVYCGCCPYEHCPNVRPAIALLKKMNFTHFYLLDLPNNIKKDWIDKGYPTVEL